ncbi:Maf family protein [Bradymonas sediminis]|uniref:7-methyl-GTP pyrophosphatase n=1 Tax=Bradymonas sediminis TaxID=1548548 RepID=A0A2Z4FME1_9DELT|nr:Maf family protein [Bradymonas sediminis]AWV90157.1 septum formation protein Maf [Bradymonas sediminis]TDP75875.1 septum formation protein [Bradymonas sediminis]
MNQPDHNFPRLILATESTFKRELLERLSIPFESVAAKIDERPLAGESPADTARRLARQKAEAVAAAHPGAWVIGADQVIALGDTRFSKPKTAERACAQLAELSGQTHALLTAVALVTPGGAVSDDLAKYQMEMRALTSAQIAQYIAEDQPLGCAGSYMIEAGGIRLFRAMRGDDYTAIIGLPLTRVHTLLERAGFFDVA